MLIMAVRFASKLPQTLVLPTEVSERRVYVGVESHDVKAVLAQFRKTPCVTVQVKVTSPGHAAVLPPCSTLFQSTGQNTHLSSKTVILPVLAFKKNSTHLHSSQPKLSPVSESSTHPLQIYLCFLLLTSRPGSYAHKPTPYHCP